MNEVARMLAPAGEDYLKQQLAFDKVERVRWIEGLASWEIMATGTFRWQASLDSARRVFEKFMSRKYPHLSYFYALERNPGRDGFHVHSLWADCRGLYCKEAWHDWWVRYGRNLVDRIRNKRDSSEYAAKYLCKENSGDYWWNVKLQWHRWKAIQDGTNDRPALLLS